MSTSRYPIAVLVSGTGSNLQAIIDAAEDPGYGARVVVVISDRPVAKALDRAATAGIPAEAVDWSDYESRVQLSPAICDIAGRYKAQALILAGFMRVLAPVAIDRFPNRIINIHPALLPSFPGTNAVRESLAHGVAITGVTVHFVDEQVDHGPIIYQEPVPVLADDDEGTLHARIREVEHRVYPRVVDALSCGELVIEGRRVVWEGQ